MKALTVKKETVTVKVYRIGHPLCIKCIKLVANVSS